MIRFTVIEDGEPKEFGCGDSCPAVEFFKPKADCLEAPDIYDDYFRRYTPEEYKHVQERGITAMNGCTGATFWSYLMEIAVYTADGIFNNGLAESYESAKEKIGGISSDHERRNMKMRLLERLGLVNTKLRRPGDDVDSLESFGAFVHLLTSGMTDYVGKDVTIMVVQEEDLNKAEDLAPFMDYFDNQES
jgi:hypothetical protein